MSFLIQVLPRSSSGALFCVCAENSLEKPGACELVLSSACPAPRAFLLLRLPRQRAGWGGPRRWQGTQRGHLPPAPQRGIPQHRRPCSAIKPGGGGWRGLPLLGDCLAVGRLVGSSCFLLHPLFFLGFLFPTLPCVLVFSLPFLFSFESSLYLKPRVFSLLPLPFSPANPPAGERASGRVVLSRWPGLNRNNLSAKELPTEGESARPASSVRVRASPVAQRDARKPQQSACCRSRFQSFLGELRHF